MHKTQAMPQPMRCLKIAELLFKNVVDGMSNNEVATAMRISPVMSCRDLDVLVQAGWASKLENGRYAVTTLPVSLMRVYELSMEHVENRLSTFRQHVNARALRTLPQKD